MVDTITHSFAQAGQSDRTDTHNAALAEDIFDELAALQ
jgi:hypothetical protein